MGDTQLSRDSQTLGTPGEVFTTFLKLGLTSFGGPIAHLGYFREELVNRRKWLSDHAYADLVALCQFLPGPASSQVGFALGMMRAGWLGALAAFTAFTLPSALVLLVFAMTAASIAGPIGTGALHGLKIVAVAIVAQAVWGMAKNLCPDKERAAIAVIAVGMLAFLPGAIGMVGAIIVGAALGLFSAARFYMVSWIGERVTADLRNAVYAHVVEQSPEFFETTQTGEVLSRLTTDTTLVQTVVGSSLSMGLRNTVMGIGAVGMLIITNPVVMTQVLGILVLVVLPSWYFGQRVRKLSRASQDRVADTSAIAAEVLNAIPVVQSYNQQRQESDRFSAATEAAFDVARKRTRVRSMLVAFIITATFGALLWGLYQGTQAVIRGDISAGHLGQTVVYVLILVSSVAVLSEVYGDLLRAAGATERLMELLATRSPVAEPSVPRALPSAHGGS
ncbi:MAG: hypothetical protein HC783_00005, partial [Rhodobacteraceae bacterium]|nr:hypothetical protein [Paracoccaceae bacterium]